MNRIIQGHIMDIAPTLPEVDMVVTSPPYWGLRAYDTESQVWGGDKDCVHEWGEGIRGAGKNNDMTAGEIQKCNKGSIGRDDRPESNFCLHCNAWRGELGLEPDPDLFIEHLCDVMDVLPIKKTGSLWVNLGDSYGGNNSRASQGGRAGYGTEREGVYKKGDSKCLGGIPARFQIEMCNRGWILRNIIIWHKPNPMPASANDRFTVDFEYLFFFTKQGRYYFEQQFEKHHPDGRKQTVHKGCPKYTDGVVNKAYAQPHERWGNPLGRNMRTVWKIPTQSFPEAHFATYPEKLIETPIKAGCPEYVCKKCGVAREKIYEGRKTDAFNIRIRDAKAGRLDKKSGFQRSNKDQMSDKEADYNEGEYGGEGKKFIGYAECGCESPEYEPGIVLDPFMGSGTTAIVCHKLGRRWLGIELQPKYVEIAEARIAEATRQGRLFNMVGEK